MSLQFFEKYLRMDPEDQGTDFLDPNTAKAGSVSTVHGQYNQLLKLITMAIDMAMPPTLILSGDNADLVHTLKLTAPTECYRDHKNGKQRPTDFAPSEINITPVQYQLAQHDSAHASSWVRDHAIKDSLGPYLAPITFTIGLCTERYILQDSMHPARHCILFHENLAKETTSGSSKTSRPALITSISEYFL